MVLFVFKLIFFWGGVHVIEIIVPLTYSVIFLWLLSRFYLYFCFQEFDNDVPWFAFHSICPFWSFLRFSEYKFIPFTKFEKVLAIISLNIIFMSPLLPHFSILTSNACILDKLIDPTLLPISLSFHLKNFNMYCSKVSWWIPSLFVCLRKPLFLLQFLRTISLDT